MRKLTNVFVFIILVMSGFQSFGQTFGIRGGLNICDFKNFKDTELLFASHIGITAEYDVTDMVSFETGLFFTEKKAKFELNEEIEGLKITAKTTASPLYLEVPLNARLNFGTDALNIYVAAGPYIAFGIGGTVNYDFESKGGGLPTDIKKGKEDIKWSSDDGDHFERFEFGASIGAGIELGRLGFGIQYGLGLTELKELDEDDTKAPKHAVLGLTLAYKF